MSIADCVQAMTGTFLFSFRDVMGKEYRSALVTTASIILSWKSRESPITEVLSG